VPIPDEEDPQVNDFGGVDLESDAKRVAPNRFRKLRNYYPPRGKRRILGKRYGSSLYNATPVASVTHVDGLIRGWHNDNTKALLAMMNLPAGDDILAGNDGAGTFASLTFAALAAPGGALTPVVGGAGNVTAGTHSYVYTNVSVNGETLPGPASAQITAAGGGSAVNLSAIAIGPAGTTQRGVYRRVAGDAGAYKLVQYIADNVTTSITDNVPDGSLGAAAPSVNTTAGAALPAGKRWQARNWPLLGATYFACGDAAAPIQRTKDFLSRSSLIAGAIPDAIFGAFVELYFTRLVTAGTPANPNFFYYYDVGSDTSIQPENFGRISEPVTAVGKNAFSTADNSLQEQLLLWGAHSMWSVNGDPTQNGVQQISRVIGCKSPKTVVNTPIGLMFLGSDRQIYLCRSAGEPERVGNRIRADLLVIAETQLANATACYHNGFYKLSFAGDGGAGNTTQYWADLDPVLTGSPEIEWYGPHDGQVIGCFCVEDGPSDALPLVGGADNAGTVYKLDQAGLFADLGVAIQGEWWTKEFDEDETLRQKIWPGLGIGYLKTNAGAATITAVLDAGASLKVATLTWGASGALWDVALWDVDLWGGDQFVEDVVNYGDRVVGTTIQWRALHTTAADWQIRDFTRKARVIGRLK
jgi:hypothetical protein